MPRTTLDIDPLVHEALRRRSQQQHRSMGRVASELLAAALDDVDAGETAAPAFAWRSKDLGVALVDLEDKDAVRRALERR